MVPGEMPMVLLAEDDDEMRDLLRGRLTREGMKVVDVEDGFELHDYLELCQPGGRVATPDIVVTDVKMPGESGPEALEQSPFVKAPVVLISGCPAAELRTLAARLGAAAVIEKPFELELLIRAIWRVLRVSPSSRRW